MAGLNDKRAIPDPAIGAATVAGGRPGLTTIEDNTPGMIDRGNIDLANRPVVKNKDGSISTVRTMSFNADGKEILVPTVSEDGRIMSEDEAIEQFFRTGKHLGTFKDPGSATAYGKRLHDQQERMYRRKKR